MRDRPLDVLSRRALAVGLVLSAASQSAACAVPEPQSPPPRLLAVTVAIPSAADVNEQIDLQRRLLQRVRILPGVERASAVGPPPERRSAWAVEAITPDFFATTGIQLLLGRPFVERDDRGGPPIAIVSESLARRLWPQRSPLGERLPPGGPEEPPRTVVGVVSDTRLEPDGPVREVVYVPHAQTGGSSMTLLVKTPGDLDGLGGAVEHEVAGLDGRLRIVEHAVLEDPCRGRERCWCRVEATRPAASRTSAGSRP